MTDPVEPIPGVCGCIVSICRKCCPTTFDSRSDRPEAATTARTWVLLVKPNGEAAPHYCHDDSYCRNRQTHEHVPVVEQAALDEANRRIEFQHGTIVQEQKKLAAETQRADAQTVEVGKLRELVVIGGAEIDRLAKKRCMSAGCGEPKDARIHECDDRRHVNTRSCHPFVQPPAAEPPAETKNGRCNDCHGMLRCSCDPPADAAGQRGETVRLHRYVPDVLRQHPQFSPNPWNSCSHATHANPDYEHRTALLLPEGDGAGKEG